MEQLKYVDCFVSGNLCLFIPSEGPCNYEKTMLRISGKVDFLHDKKLKERVLNDRPFLKQFGFTPDSPELILSRLTRGEAHFWTMDANLSPKEAINFKFEIINNSYKGSSKNYLFNVFR